MEEEGSCVNTLHQPGNQLPQTPQQHSEEGWGVLLATKDSRKVTGADVLRLGHSLCSIINAGEQGMTG